MPWKDKEAKATYFRKWRVANKDKVREQKRRYYERYPERKKAEALRAKERRREKRDAVRAKACEVCSAKGPTVYDHCHEFGHFRGWLCNGCNSALGFARDNPETLRLLADYLERDWYKSA